MPVERVARLELRRVWVQIHLWLGLTLGVLGALIGVTGSLLVRAGARHVVFYRHFPSSGCCLRCSS